MNRVLLIPCVLLVVLGLAGYFASAGAFSATGKDRPIVICYADELKTLDVGQMSWANDIRTAMALWEGLTTYPADSLNPIPGAAESWDISPDQKTYTFHLRKNGCWSDGDPVTAQDFIFAWQRVFVPSTRANYVTLFNVIEGAEDYAAAMGKYMPGDPLPDFSKVKVSAPDPYTLVVTLKHPRSYFLDFCAFPTYFPLHQKTMQPFANDPANSMAGYREQWQRPPNLVTNGAFHLADWKFKRQLELVPNEHYWDRNAVHCNHLFITSIADGRAALLAFQSGAVDLLTFIPPQFGEDLLKQLDAGRTDIHYLPVFGSYYFIFNCQRPPFTDARVRKAFALATDRVKIANDVVRLRTRPMGLIVPPDAIPGYKSPGQLDMNVEEARRLLAEAAFPNGQGMHSVEIVYNSEAIHDRISQAIGEMWKQNLGVNVTYRALERGSFGTVRQVEHSFDVARAGWYGDYADPTTWLNLLKTGDENNDGLYSNPQYDALLDKADATLDNQQRLNILSEAEGLLVQKEFPFIPLYQYSDGYMYDAGKLGGVAPNVRLLSELKWIHRK